MDKDKIADKNDSVNIVYKEIDFFMTRCFNFSYLYLVGVFGISAASMSGGIKLVASEFHIHVITLICYSILVLNALYTTSLFGCLFAVQKRGLFILMHYTRIEPMWQWEAFRRKGIVSSKITDINWNMDSLFFWCNGNIGLHIIWISVLDSHQINTVYT